MTDEELINMVANCPVKPGSKWKHYRGAVVDIVKVAVDEETLQPAIVYKHNQVEFVRTLSNWQQKVETSYFNFVPRFTPHQE